MSTQVNEKENEQKELLEYLKLIADFIPAACYCTDLAGRFIYVNNKFLEVIGVDSKEQIIGKAIYELYDDEAVASKLQQDITYVICSRSTSVSEDAIVNMTTKNTKYFSATRAPLYSKSGNLIGIIGTSIDVSDKKRLNKRNNKRL